MASSRTGSVRRVGDAEGVAMLPAPQKAGPALQVLHDDSSMIHYEDFSPSYSTSQCLLVYFAFLLSFLLVLIICASRASAKGESPATTALIVVSAVGLWVSVIVFFRMVMVIGPNEGVVLTSFGNYVGTIKTAGFHATWPWISRRSVSFRLKNFVSEQLKVSDARSNPIVISAVVAWSIGDAAKAIFSTLDIDTFVRVQSEGAVRAIAARFPYDSYGVNDEISLTSNSGEVLHSLLDELHSRFGSVGIVVHDTNLVRLAYADEVASSMLQRQMASAVVAARSQIVTGAVLMVEDALGQLAARNICEMSPQERTRLASNLLTVLCGDSRPTATVSVGGGSS
eukprot:a496_78.p1 GENE.a496_78~~a496_78.p1  ORF type:complete len:358 (+),score=123.30 a496_78:56-1075(+)